MGQLEQLVIKYMPLKENGIKIFKNSIEKYNPNLFYFAYYL